MHCETFDYFCYIDYMFNASHTTKQLKYNLATSDGSDLAPYNLFFHFFKNIANHLLIYQFTTLLTSMCSV